MQSNVFVVWRERSHDPESHTIGMQTSSKRMLEGGLCWDLWSCLHLAVSMCENNINALDAV